ncbi:anti-sigma factor [Niallia sp. MER 6]|uniref:anti-sigma factor n=1 Tax=Niallia sp. MER 6 TaxID=2939567 RepID=UPI00203F5F51|nr:anti-sigma factor [Niallia sp. MER 6]MCM3030848.1 anti-sigma factor [Niallia sp. MER 6]
MTNSQDSKKMYDLAEKIALDDFDSLAGQHEFSDTYNHKKKLFMEEIKAKREQQKIRRKKNRLLIAAACLLIGIPTTAFGAVKVYDMTIQKQNYEVDISVTNTNTNNQDKWYKLKIANMPENMEEVRNTDGMKFSFKDNYAQGGFSFSLMRVGGKSDFQTLYANNYEEKEINGRKAVIISKDSVNESMTFDRQVYLLFENEGIMLESYVGADVNEDVMMKVLEDISLVPTSKEKATPIIEYEEAQISDDQTEFKVIPLNKDSNRLFSIGEVVPVTIEELVNGSNGTVSKMYSLEYTVNKVEVYDSIKDFKQGNFNEIGLEMLTHYNAIDQEKTLIPYKRNIYKMGDGKDTIDKLVDTQLINGKFVYLTTTVTNTSNQATEEIYMHPSLQVLKSEGNAWNYANFDGNSEHSIMTGEVDYLEPHGSGKSFYNIGSIQPGQTKKINLGYFVDEDKLDSIFLDVFHYSGSGITEDLNAEDRWWIDIRQ